MSVPLSLEARIVKKLQDAFAPETLAVENESHQHAGHAGSPGSGESHFRVKMVSAAFADKSRVDRHRMINEALADELAGGIHALALELKAPGE